MAPGDCDVKLTNTRSFPCASFDGVDDYVEVPHSAAQLGANLANGFSISAWIYPISLGEDSAGRIIDKSTGASGENGFRWRLVDVAKLRFTLNAAAGNYADTAAASITFGRWQHVLITVTSAQISNQYINGVQSGTANYNLVENISTITTTNDLTIGNRSEATSTTFNGGIRSVKMWNKVLSAAEIASDYAGSPTAEDNLIHYFKLASDYADSGTIGKAGTNSGSVFQTIEDAAATVVKAQRAGATDKYLCAEINGKLMTAVIQET